MARAAKKGGEDGGGAAKPSEVRKAISQKKLRSLLASARSTKADVDEIVGGHRSEIADAVERNFLHKGVFATIKRLDRMEPEKLAEWRDTFDHYWDISGLDDRAKSAPAMQFEEVDDVDNQESGKGAKNVKPFPQPRSEAAE